jgi:hypothetical protein
MIHVMQFKRDNSIPLTWVECYGIDAAENAYIPRDTILFIIDALRKLGFNATTYHRGGGLRNIAITFKDEADEAEFICHYNDGVCIDISLDRL